MNSMGSYPIGVGGVGGSGTRVIASLLLKLGYQLGGDLNIMLDNLWFTLLFKRPVIYNNNIPEDEFENCWNLFRTAMEGGDNAKRAELETWASSYLNTLVVDGRPQHSSEWLAERAHSLRSVLQTSSPLEVRPWAWKEPNTHIVLPNLMCIARDLKYIHVMRNGLDMAWSTNQNQLMFWGNRFLSEEELAASRPRALLKYWCRTHQRIFEIARLLPGRFFILNFDALCLSPVVELGKLLDFLQINYSISLVSALSELIQSPNSLGRYQFQPLDVFDPEDVIYVRSLGYS
jgi:hypothetical protein